MNNIVDEELNEALEYLAESYYPEHEYGNSHADSNKELVAEALAKVKQVFKDTGYLYLPTVKPGDFILIDGGEVILNGDGTMTKVRRMTGQEWYDRFEKEMCYSHVDTQTYAPKEITYLGVLKAARRAAGLKDTEE